MQFLRNSALLCTIPIYKYVVPDGRDFSRIFLMSTDPRSYRKNIKPLKFLGLCFASLRLGVKMLEISRQGAKQAKYF
jgi:hypothetical protein